MVRGGVDHQSQAGSHPGVGQVGCLIQGHSGRLERLSPLCRPFHRRPRAGGSPEGICQQPEHRRCSRYKLSVEVNHPQEVLQLLDGIGPGVGGDGGHSARQWCDAAGGDSVAQEFDVGLPKLALLRVGGQAGRPEAGESLLQVTVVVFLGLAKYQDVV